jgi:hypothetical protein
MSVLNVWAGRTSNCFRVTSDGIPFGRGFGAFGSCFRQGGSASASGWKRSRAKCHLSD